MDQPSNLIYASELQSVMKPGPAGKRPTQFLKSGELATRANVRRAIYLMGQAAARARRVVTYRKDKDGNKVPFKVLHETKGWQSARIGL